MYNMLYMFLMPEFEPDMLRQSPGVLPMSYAHPSVNVGLDFYVSAGGGEMPG